MKIQPVAILFFLGMLAACGTGSKQPNTSDWHPVNLRFPTPWSEKVQPESPWPAYPRPQMTRDNWLNLNGLWDYAILPRFGAEMDSAQGQILVPYPVESPLSGVGRSPGIQNDIWYRRAFSVPESWAGQRVLLHFEASDWETSVRVDGKAVGVHKGGYDPFSFDITDFVSPGKTHTLTVNVWDPADLGHYNPHGNQSARPSGVFHTSASGIWQTVWLEPVPQTYIADLHIAPHFDEKAVVVSAEVRHARENQVVSLAVTDEKGQIHLAKAAPGQPLRVGFEEVRAWSPDDPFLYALTVRIQEGGEAVDEVKSYFGMRKSDLQKDEKGQTRLFLNNEYVFQNGILDAGIWPDGVYTPPTDEAMRADIETAKKSGFNLLRKYAKVESRRFYYWCDQIGVLVWQDMPAMSVGHLMPGQPDLTLPEPQVRQFETELRQMILTHFNHPSIVVWVPFQEGWGQHRSAEIAEIVRHLDPGRLLDLASGWESRGLGDLSDLHHFPDPNMPDLETGRAAVLGEFGRISFPVENHVWSDLTWGFQKVESEEELRVLYENYRSTIRRLEQDGLSAAVFAQLTDVETQTNGLMTFDRQVQKMPAAFLRAIHSGDYVVAPLILPEETHFSDALAIAIKHPQQLPIYYTLDGSEPGPQSKRYDGIFSIAQTTTLKAVAIAPDGRKSQVVSRHFEQMPIGKPRYLFAWHPKYSAGGEYALFDGKTGSLDFSDGRWQGFLSVPAAIDVKLPAGRVVHEVEMGFLQSQLGRIFLPKKVIVSISDDGNIFTDIGERDFEPTPDNKPSIERVRFKISRSEPFRYLKINAVNISVCPEWHDAAGQPAWLFMDEITLR